MQVPPKRGAVTMSSGPGPMDSIQRKHRVLCWLQAQQQRLCLLFALLSAQLGWIARRTPDARARVEVMRHLRNLERLLSADSAGEEE